MLAELMFRIVSFAFLRVGRVGLLHDGLLLATSANPCGIWWVGWPLAAYDTRATAPKMATLRALADLSLGGNGGTCNVYVRLRGFHIQCVSCLP